MYRLSKRSLNHLNGVNAFLIAILVRAIEDSPHDFGIPKNGGLRSEQKQFELYRQGRTYNGKDWLVSNSDEVVTYLDGYDKKSKHQKGEAFDIFGYKEGKATWDKKILSEIAEHIKLVAKYQFNVDLTWGGDWKMEDMPHFQID
jgi:peptidoglycan L-alanyl-D-glutamate endopeptidase CwlK